MVHNLLKCGKCGWVHFEVSRSKAEAEVESFNKYFETLSKEDQESFYGGKGSSIESYEHCFRCGESHEKAVEAKEGEAPLGATLNPMICPTDFGTIKLPLK